MAQTIEERRVTEENDIVTKHFFMKTIVILPRIIVLTAIVSFVQFILIGVSRVQMILEYKKFV